jgi:hypothetical protein
LRENNGPAAQQLEIGAARDQNPGKAASKNKIGAVTWEAEGGLECRYDNLGTGNDICWVLDLTDIGMRIIFYPWVIPESDLNQDGYETSIFSTCG